MSIERFRMSKKNVTRLFVGAIVAVVAGFILGCAALLAALASDAIDLGGSDYIGMNGGSGAWTALGLVIVGSLAALGGTIATVVSWIGALLNVATRRQDVVRLTARRRAARLGRRRDDRLRRRRPRRLRSRAWRQASMRVGGQGGR